MIYRHNNKAIGAEFRMIAAEADFDRVFYGRDRADKLLTIAWNPGAAVRVSIDGISYDFPAHSMLNLFISTTQPTLSPGNSTGSFIASSITIRK